MLERPEDDEWAAEREQMLSTLRWHGIRDARILAAMRAVPRHRFIPPSHRGRDAYGDHPCPIGHGQTISQPFIVAHMSLRLEVRPGMRVLEVGTGCGYQAAVLAELGAVVFTIERVGPLAEYAREALAACGYDSVKVRAGDGYLGWPEEAPFDGVLAACAAPNVPQALVGQLADGGRMILPVGTDLQRLVLLRRTGSDIEQNDDLWVRFVPMVPGPG
jgi:protein-L-isoaspartate(D-aspartate) O-methyltransferase